MTMCDIPDSVRSIADAYCKTVLNRLCPKIPFGLIYLSSPTSENITCQKDGRIINGNDKKTSKNSSEDRYTQCIKSPALILFENNRSYPSLITDGYDPITKELFDEVLSQHYRLQKSIWGLTHLGESSAYYPWSGDKKLLSLFDITMGYDRRLYHVASNEYLPWDLYYLIDKRVSVDSALLEKNQALSYVTSPVLWMSSNCYTPSNRTEYMRELMRYISVDAWGDCGRNKGPKLPPEIAHLQKPRQNGSRVTGGWQELKKALSKIYRFTVAIENSLEYDYVTEKLWQPLAVGSVPLYYGAPNIDEWLPCEDCIIDLRKFDNPRAAAQFIKAVADNETRYAEFHKWRNQPVPIKFKKLADYFERTKPYSIDCMICAMAHSDNPQSARYNILNKIADRCLVLKID